MDAINLTHMQLAKVEPGSLVLIGARGADAEQYFAIAVHRAGEPSLTSLVCFRADRGALRAVRVELSASEAPDRFVLSLGRRFTIEPNLFEQVRADIREGSALNAGDLLVRDAQQLLVVAPAAKGTQPLVVDLAGGEVTELSDASVAVVTHWNIYVRNADGQQICLVDTKSHKQATALATSGLRLQATG
jgi:hypothetical protein